MDVELLGATMNHLGARSESSWLARNGVTKHRSQFLRRGYFSWDLPPHIVHGLRGFFAAEIRTTFSPSDYREDYVPWTASETEMNLLNQESVYFGLPNPAAVAVMEDFLHSIKDEIEEQLGYCWRIYNVRAWSVRPGSAFGPNAWHSDGFSLYRRKLMFYLDPPNEHNGSIEFADRNENMRILESDVAQCILFDTAILMHRARPPKTGVRPSIEVTTIPSMQTSTKCIFAGHAALVPKHINGEIADRLDAGRYRGPEDVKSSPNEKPRRSLTSRLSKAAQRLVRKMKQALRGTGAKDRDEEAMEVRKAHCRVRLNIGGAPTLGHDGWMNLGPVAGPGNEFPFGLDETTLFPVPSSTVSTIYLSDCLEHLDDKALAHILGEVRRVIADHGDLVAKVADFGARAKRRREGDNSNGFRSRDELVGLLEGAGFSVRTVRANQICNRFSGMPNIKVMKKSSFYCHAVPAQTSGKRIEQGGDSGVNRRAQGISRND